MMQRLLLISGFAMLLLCSAFVGGESCTVKTNGVYTTPHHSDSTLTRYLRFYDDGTAVAVDSDMPFKRVMQWFNREHEDIAMGKYKLKKCKLKFELKNSGWEFLFEGTVKGDKLQLTKINTAKPDQSIKLNYTFKPTS